MNEKGSINVWPYPQSIVTDQTYFTLNPKTFNFTLQTKGKCDLLEKTIARYRDLLFLEDCSHVSKSANLTFFERKSDIENDIKFRGNLANITVMINQKCEVEPHMNMNEMYAIDINQQIAQIFAEDVWGAIRAIETFTQLVVNVGLNQFIVNTTSILDYPRFAHRGVMLDTSRHYVPIRELEQNLDAMAYNKLNVFHWHIVDDQSFPYVSQIYPQLSLKGAYNPKTHIYTADDIQHVIQYAIERGIRVLVEFDTPGHTLSWGNGQPGLLTPCYTGKTPNGEFGPIDPIRNSSYQFIETLFKEVVNRFPDQYLHLGGDEVDFTCWASNPDILKYMTALNITDNFAKLEEIYIQKVLDIVKTLNRSYIVWQEVFDNGVNIKDDTLVHVWKDGWQQEIYNVTLKGYQSLLSSCWYLNYISYGTDWPQYYACDPQNFNGTEAQNKLVIGGEACMWGKTHHNLNG